MALRGPAAGTAAELRPGADEAAERGSAGRPADPGAGAATRAAGPCAAGIGAAPEGGPVPARAGR